MSIAINRQFESHHTKIYMNPTNVYHLKVYLLRIYDGYLFIKFRREIFNSGYFFYFFTFLMKKIGVKVFSFLCLYFWFSY